MKIALFLLALFAAAPAVAEDPFPGLKTHEIKDYLTIYSTPAQKEAVAAIPKGTMMTALLADNDDHYLIKTAFGLVGWLTIPADSQVATVIDGFFFAGD
jgi:hypothetical protein